MATFKKPKTGLGIIFLLIVTAKYNELKIGELELGVMEPICLWI